MKGIAHAVLIVLAAAINGSAAAEMGEFPRFDFEDAEPVVVIGTVAYGGPLSLPECELPRGICMDTEPMWLRVTVKQRVIGDVPDEFAIATTFHETRRRLEAHPDRPSLLVLRTDGESYVLGRGHQAPAHRSAGGNYIVPLVRGPLFYLPCAAGRATVEIGQRDVAPFMWWSRDGSEHLVADRAGEVVFDRDRWRPRYALSSDKLASVLRESRAAGDAFECSSAKKRGGGN